MKRAVLLLLVCTVASLTHGQMMLKNVPADAPNDMVYGDCDDPCEAGNGYKCVPCCPTCGGTANGAPAGTASPSVCSLDIGISTGRNKPGVPLPGGLVRIKASEPSDALYSPQTIGFSMGLTISSVSTNNPTTNGTPRQVTILGASCQPIVYEFADNVATGLPTGRYSASLDRLIMCDSNGAPVLQNPRHYELRLTTGAKYRFGADRQNEDYLGLISFTTAYGRIGTLRDGGIKVIRDANEIIRQINVPDCLVDVVVSTNIGYEMRFYTGTARGTWNPSLGRYDSLGTPFVVNRVEDPDNGVDGNKRVRFVQERPGAITKQYTYTYTSASQAWELTDGDGLSTETLDAQWDQNHVCRIETRTVAGAVGSAVIHSSERYQVFPFGERLVQKSTGTGGDIHAEVITYYESGSETGKYSRVNSQVKPDGSWMRYDYDVQGRRTLEIMPWKDAAFGNTNAGRRVCLDYAAHDPVDQGVDAYLPRTKTEIVGNVTNALTYFAFYTNASGEQIEIEENCPSSSASYGDPANLRKTTIHYAASGVLDAVAGQLKSVVQPNGLMDSYTYEYGYYHATNAAPAGYWFEPDADGDSLRVTVVHGTTNQPNGVAYQTTRQTTIKDSFNNKALEETYVCTGGPNYTRIAWTAYEYDFLGHPVKEYRSDGTELDSTWTSCCGKESETLADGTQKAYEYDMLNRLLAETRIGTNSADDVLTEYTYDAAGRRLTEVRSGGGLSLATRSAYDLAGRLTNTVDEAGIATRYEYGNGGLIKRTIRAGVTNVTENYLDGRAKNITDNGVLKTFYDHGVNADGSKWSKVYTGPAGTNSPVWTKTSTDMLGRTIQTEQPGYGGTVITNTYVYNGKGQLVAAQMSGFSPQPSATFYEYNELGEQTRSGIDLNNNGVLDLAGPDRISEAQTFYETDASNNMWQVRTSVLYARDNSAVPVTNSVTRTRVGGASCGCATQMAESRDLLGNRTVSRTIVDRANKTVTQVVTYPDSTNDAMNVTVNGLLRYSISKTGVRTENMYDALGRQVRAQSASGAGVPSPRFVASVTHYNNKGQVDWTEDATSNRTTYTYDSATGLGIMVTDALANATHTAYDAEGRVLATWGATYPVAYDYDSYGRMTAMYTLRDSSLVITDYSGLRSQISSFDKTTWSYDPATGLLTNKLYADNKGPSYAYTADGKLASRTWVRGIVTAYTYDGAGQMTNINYSDTTPDVSFTFDRLGRQTTITDGQGARSFNYNDALQLAAETNSQGVLAYVFDPYGRPGGFDAGTGYSVRYGYDTVGRFSSVSSSVQSASSMVQYSRLAGSDQVAGWSNDTGFAVARTYEANRDLITQVLNMAGTNVISQFDYENDAVGRRERRVDTSIMSIQSTNAFGYNVRSELVDATMGTNRYSYLYDPIGNRQAATNNTTITKYTANALNQYSQITNTQSPITIVPTYDDDGNMTSYNGWTFTWDAENRLVLASNGTTVVSNAYDYMSRRIVKAANGSSRTFLYDGWAMIRDATAGETNSYIYGLDLSGTLQGAGTIGGLLATVRSGDPEPVEEFYAYDANGNVVDLVDTSGAAIGHYEYDPYGNTTAISGPLASVNPFRFSTKYLDDETDMYYYGFRFLLPEVGRWVSRDSARELGFRVNQGLGFGQVMESLLFVFAKNDPDNRVDATGLCDQSVNEPCTLYSTRQVVKNVTSTGGDYTGKFSCPVVDRLTHGEATCSCERDARDLYGDIYSQRCVAATIFKFKECNVDSCEPGTMWKDYWIDFNAHYYRIPEVWEVQWVHKGGGTNAYEWAASQKGECAYKCAGKAGQLK